MDKTKDLPGMFSLFLSNQSPELCSGWEDGQFCYNLPDTRLEILPDYLVYRNHPAFSAGLALVYESCSEELLFKHDTFKNLSVPTTSCPTTLFQMGYLEVKPKMAVFYRDLKGSCLPEDDVLKVWVSDEIELAKSHPDQLAALVRVRDKFFGPKEELFGGKKGGTALERSGRGHGNLQGSRCHTFGNSVESVRHIVHPCGNLSQREQSDDEMLGHISMLLKVSSYINAFSLSY